MRRVGLLLLLSCFAVTGNAGFKAKNIKPRKPEQFQTRATVSGVVFAADLLVSGREQKEYFYKELTPSHIVAVRLAIFNKGAEEVQLASEGVRLSGPDGKELPMLAPETVAQSLLKGLVIGEQAKSGGGTVGIGPSTRTGDPRDRSDPRYDPRMDPTDPGYDPNDPRNRGYTPNSVPWGRPGVDVVLNPGGNTGTADLSQFEKQLIEKDFSDKAHSTEPILPASTRDRFLYFSLPQEGSAVQRGFTLLVQKGRGIPEDVVLKF